MIHGINFSPYFPLGINVVEIGPLNHTKNAPLRFWACVQLTLCVNTAKFPDSSHFEHLWAKNTEPVQQKGMQHKWFDLIL